MIAVPLVVVWVSSQILYFKLPMISAVFLSLVLSFVCTLAASRIWERRSKTAEISFSELMIWSWYRLQKAERKLEQGLRAAETAGSHNEQLLVLHELTAALESKDPYTRGHSRRVERHSFKTGVALGLALPEVEALRMSASLHDVGKIRVPNRVLHKPGALSGEERALIEEHPVLGSEMVASIGDEQVVAAVRHHHERWDGDGYPDGIADTEIPLFSRVIAVADSYDAIRSNRSYRRGASRDEAVEVLTEEAGHQFDPQVVDAFLTTLPARGRAVAAVMTLTTGPAALWRYIQQLFQRFGSTALAPALGAAGTAVIIGTTSLLAPPDKALASPPDEVPHVTIFQTPSPDPGEDRERLKAEQLAAEERAIRRAVQRKKRKAKEAAALAAAASKSPSSPQEDPSSSDSQASDPSATEPVPAAGTSSDDQAATGDPNKAGQDCEEGTRKRSKGSRRHCD